MRIWIALLALGVLACTPQLTGFAVSGNLQLDGFYSPPDSPDTRVTIYGSASPVTGASDITVRILEWPDNIEVGSNNCLSSLNCEATYAEDDPVDSSSVRIYRIIAANGVDTVEVTVTVDPNEAEAPIAPPIEEQQQPVPTPEEQQETPITTPPQSLVCEAGFHKENNVCVADTISPACGNAVLETGEECEKDADCAGTCEACKCEAPSVTVPEPIMVSGVEQPLTFSEVFYKDVIGDCRIPDIEEFCKSVPGGRLPCFRAVRQNEVLPPFSILNRNGIAITPLQCPEITEMVLPQDLVDKTGDFVSEGIWLLLR